MIEKEQTKEEILKLVGRVFHYGQTYSYQADSDSYLQNKRADITLEKYVSTLNDIKRLLKELTDETQPSS